MMHHKYMAFDLEIAKVFPEGTTDWREHRPLGISCAATLAADASLARLWYSTANGEPLPAMTVEDVRSMITFLHYKATHEGYTILSWNGLSFDFDVLCQESIGLDAICIDLAKHHVDMMWHIFCLKNHYLGLNKAAVGMGVPGKLDEVDGAKAPEMWQRGEYATVLEYVAQDVKCTLDVALAVEQAKQLRWISNKGRLNTLPIDRWLTVDEAAQLPLPDTSWMDKPVKRSQFTAWMKQPISQPSDRLVTFLQKVFEQKITNGEEIPQRDVMWLKQWR
jgi:Predicted 3'-5' exonuclease related to the exonuclease domain of PolB